MEAKRPEAETYVRNYIRDVGSLNWGVICEDD